MSGQVNLSLTKEYAEFLENLKAQVASSRYRAVRSVNTEMIQLYHHIGTAILKKQSEQGWGSKIIDKLSKDLLIAFPNMKGFSVRNLKYMRKFAEEYHDTQFVQEALAQLTWYHNITLLDKISDKRTRLFYEETKALEESTTQSAQDVKNIEDTISAHHSKGVSVNQDITQEVIDGIRKNFGGTEAQAYKKAMARDPEAMLVAKHLGRNIFAAELKDIERGRKDLSDKSRNNKVTNFAEQGKNEINNNPKNSLPPSELSHIPEAITAEKVSLQDKHDQMTFNAYGQISGTNNKINSVLALKTAEWNQLVDKDTSKKPRINSGFSSGDKNPNTHSTNPGTPDDLGSGEVPVSVKNNNAGGNTPEAAEAAKGGGESSTTSNQVTYVVPQEASGDIGQSSGAENILPQSSSGQGENSSPKPASSDQNTAAVGATDLVANNTANNSQPQTPQVEQASSTLREENNSKGNTNKNYTSTTSNPNDATKKQTPLKKGAFSSAVRSNKDGG